MKVTKLNEIKFINKFGLEEVTYCEDSKLHYKKISIIRNGGDYIKVKNVDVVDCEVDNNA